MKHGIVLTLSRNFTNPTNVGAWRKLQPLFIASPIARRGTPPGPRHIQLGMAIYAPDALSNFDFTLENCPFLDTATSVRKINPHPLGDTITLRNTNSSIKEVVVDAATGKRVITVINPNK